MIICLGCSCSRSPQFKLLNASKTGVSFNNTVNESDSLNILLNEYMYNGGGVAVGDFNRDGRDDLYFTGNVVANKLYLNRGNFTFKDITEISGTSAKGKWCMGVATIDINQDGWLDLYIAVTGKESPKDRENLLFVNQGLNAEGIPFFLEKAKDYNLNHEGYSIQSYFFDYDRDGFLDVYVINNQFTNRGDILSKRKQGKNILPENINRLFKNIDGKTFRDVTDKSGLVNDAFSLSAAILDVNNDGWDDLFISNDFVTSSALYVNQKDGTFREEVEDYFKHQSFSSMGVDVADFDNNGQEDLVTLDMLPLSPKRTKRMFPKTNFLFYDLLDHYNEQPQYMRNCLYINENSQYKEISQLMGVHNTDWSWSPIFADFDNDGFKDLSITNGFPRDLTDLDFINYRDSYKSILATQKEYLNAIPQIKIPNEIFQNEGEYRLKRKTKDWGLNRDSYSYGQAYSDLDNDGDLDLIVNNINDQAYIYQNNTEKRSKNHFLRIKLNGSQQNKNALHASVTLYYDGQVQFQRNNPYRGYLSSMSPWLHFGLGKVNVIDSLVIDWDIEEQSVIKTIETNQELIFDHADLNKLSNSPSVSIKNLFQNWNDSLAIDFKHKDNKNNDFYAYELNLRTFTNEGPAMAIGDIDNDQQDDFLIGGRALTLFRQVDGGGFSPIELLPEKNKKEITTLALFDANQDNHLDIFIGYGHSGISDSISRQDALLINNGKDDFNLFPLPAFGLTSKAIPFDFDQDGDMDLFLTSLAVPESYPRSPKSYYLENVRGKFIDKTKHTLPNDGYLGNISDAQIMDIDLDGDQDIVYAGHWIGIEILKFENFRFHRVQDYFGKSINGLWNALTIDDIDNDGDQDIIAGNYGLNTPFSASQQQPFKMAYADLNGNGRPDPLLFSAYKGDYYPIHLRDNFLNQLQYKKRQFNSYTSYADASIDELFTSEEMQRLNILDVHTFSTSIFENNEGKFLQHNLPINAQFSPVFASAVIKIKGVKHLLLVGNDNAHEAFTGPKNSTTGELYAVDQFLNFKRIPPEVSGLNVQGVAKSIATITVGGKKVLLISQNNGRLLAYRMP